MEERTNLSRNRLFHARYGWYCKKERINKLRSTKTEKKLLSCTRYTLRTSVTEPETLRYPSVSLDITTIMDYRNRESLYYTRILCNHLLKIEAK